MSFQSRLNLQQLVESRARPHNNPAVIRGETHDHTSNEAEALTNAHRDDDAVRIVDLQRPTSRLAGKQLPPIAPERRREVRPVEAVEVKDLVHPHPRLRVELADRVPPLRRDQRDGGSDALRSSEKGRSPARPASP